MTPILLRDFTLRKGREHYVMTLWPVGQDPIDVETDGNMGHIMGALSVAFKAIQHRATGAPVTETAALTGTIHLSRFWVEPLTILPYRWKVSMVSGPYSFTCNVDSNLDHLIACFSAAMKFFGQKYGLCEVFPEVTYNHDVAGEMGLLEGHA